MPVEVDELHRREPSNLDRGIGFTVVADHLHLRQRHVHLNPLQRSLFAIGVPHSRFHFYSIRRQAEPAIGRPVQQHHATPWPEKLNLQQHLGTGTPVRLLQSAPEGL
eukprot:328154-Amphidinium_carterae.1